MPIYICGMWRFCTSCVLNFSNIDATSVGNCWKFFHQVGIFEVLKLTVGISNVHTLINSCLKLKRVLYTSCDWSIDGDVQKIKNHQLVSKSRQRVVRDQAGEEGIQVQPCVLPQTDLRHFYAIVYCSRSSLTTNSFEEYQRCFYQLFDCSNPPLITS